MGAVGAGAAIWPVINQMNPAADTLTMASTEVNIIEFEFKENNFYGGENLGSLESEVVGSIQVKILNDEEHSKKISSSRRFNTQSLNPLAQKELVKLMRVEIIEDLNKKIVLYLKTHEDK